MEDMGNSNNRNQMYRNRVISMLQKNNELVFYPRGFLFPDTTEFDETQQRVEDKYINTKTDYWKKRTVANNTMFDFPKNEDFPNYPANPLGDSNFIAAVGPHDNSRVEALFDATIFNNKFPVKRIVAIGSSLVASNLDFNQDSNDFMDYFTATVKFRTFGKYQVQTKQFKKVGNVTEYLLEVSDINKSDQLIVIWIKSHDHKGDLDLQHEDMIYLQENFKDKAVPALVHCHSGVKRSGVFALSICLWRNYDKIFVDNPNDAANNIIMLLKEWRQSRPFLICFDISLIAAVNLAFLLDDLNVKKTNTAEIKQDAYMPTKPESTTVPLITRVTPQKSDKQDLNQKVKDRLDDSGIAPGSSRLITLGFSQESMHQNKETEPLIKSSSTGKKCCCLMM